MNYKHDCILKKGSLQIALWKNLGFCPNKGVGGYGGSANPKFFSNFSKTKLPLELSINMKKSNA